MSETRLIVGLGNPGKDYEGTRHNLGAMVVRHLAAESGLRFRSGFLMNGLMAEETREGRKILYLLPSTYMNNSGMAVRQAVRRRSVDYEDVLIIGDDLCLDFGQIRIRPRGSDGGHNGLRSVLECLGTHELARLRLGIRGSRQGAETRWPSQDTVDYVLGEFTKEERKSLNGFVEQAAACCLVWATQGINKAMDQFNKKVNINGRLREAERKENGKNSNSQKI